MTPPGASAGRKSPKTFLTVDPRGRPYAKRHQKTLVGAQAFGVYGTVTLFCSIVKGMFLCFVSYDVRLIHLQGCTPKKSFHVPWKARLIRPWLHPGCIEKKHEVKTVSTHRCGHRCEMASLEINCGKCSIVGKIKPS